MKNPIKSARQKMGLTTTAFSILAETTVQTVRTNERGENLEISPSILLFLTDNGFNEDQLISDYKRFRAWKKSELLKSFKTKNA